MNLPERCAGPLLLAIAAACLIAQVFVRPAVGIANNGDFPKMADPLGLGPEDGGWESHRQYSEFIYRFVRDDRFNWERDFRTAEFLSSEFFFVKLARGLQRIVQPGPRFDIRWLGAVNGIFFLIAIAVWIYAIPPRWRLYAGLFVIFIWTDVAYVQYLNSFYMDTAAMIFLVLCVGAALHALKNPNSRMWPVVMAAAAVLFTVSKSQHAIPGLLFVPLLIGLALWNRRRFTRAVWLSASVLLIAGSSLVVGRQTIAWRSIGVYDVVFLRLAPQSPDPLHVLEELGLERKDLAYLGTHAFMSNSPMQNSEWARNFHTRCNNVNLARYYLRHPSSAAHFLYTGLSQSAAAMRPYANLSRDDGFPLYARTSHFTYWSDIRGFLYRHAPWHIVPLALVMIAGACWLLFQSPSDRAFAGLLLAVQAIGALELAGALLAESVETERHLFVFHVATEIAILLLAPLLLKIYRAAVPTAGPAGQAFYTKSKHVLPPVRRL